MKLLLVLGRPLILTMLICPFAQAWAAPNPAEVKATESAAPLHDVGHNEFIEVDLQAGVYSGVRGQVFVLSGFDSSLVIEGTAGWSAFDSLFNPTYGGGVRGQFNFGSDQKTSTWMISPGLNVYYIPPNQSPKSDDSIGSALASIFEAPTRAVFLSPNVDFSRLMGHFAIGLKVGLAYGLNGTDSDGKNLNGRVVPDAGLYMGLRF